MNQQSIVEMLEPLRQPEPISWWPPAPGWWVLAALLLGLFLFGLYRLWKRYLRGAPLREARTQVERLRNCDLEPHKLAAELGAVQRRVAMAILGRKACAGLTGSEWAGCLNELAADDEQYFDAQLLGLAHQVEVSTTSSEELLSVTDRWLSKLRMSS